MKDLNIVIGSLGGCIRGICSNCEYGDSDCHRDELMKDALEYLKEYYELKKAHSKLFVRYKEVEHELEDMRLRAADYQRKVVIARKERDEARREVLRLEAELIGLKWGM